MSRAEQASLEAAQWLTAQCDGPLSNEEQAIFEEWLNASDGNKAAYWRLELGWEEAGRINALDLGHDGFEPQSDSPKWRWWAGIGLAASVALMIGIYQFAGGWAVTQVGARPSELASASYSTSVGEKHLVGLPDGSRIQLNTQSSLRTRFTSDQREVWLDRGEAFFDVAHREDQPFVVHAGDREISVLGTQFSVRRDKDKTTVAVLEGRVRLVEMKDNRPVRTSLITAGDIAVASDTATFVGAKSENGVEQALSWRDGMLAFDQEPLSTIAAEFNRYNTRKLVLDAGVLGEIRITGTFPSDKPDAFARLLREAYGLRVDENEQHIRIYR
ncbi:MAG TPA: FecR family protein [Croceibacterium sp.]|nr:FecR family protein [Croceibacterium sp.]